MLEDNMILLLQSICHNFPILHEQGCVYRKPIALVLSDNVDCVSFIETISPYALIINSSTSVRNAKKYLATANLGVFMMVNSGRMKNSIKECEKFEALCSVANIGKIDGKEAHVATFLVCKQRVPDEYKESVIEIHIDKEIEMRDDDVFTFLPSKEQLPIALHRIKQLPRDELFPLMAAVDLMHPKLEEFNMLSKYEELKETAKEIDRLANIYCEQEDVKELVIDRLFEFLRDDNCQIYHLSEIDAEIEERLCEAVVLKQDSIFIDEKNFKRIVSPLLEVIPMDVLKQRLSQNGFLLGKQGDYTIKMNYFVDGELRRKRMLKLNISDEPKLKDYIYGI